MNIENSIFGGLEKGRFFKGYQKILTFVYLDTTDGYSVGSGPVPPSRCPVETG